MFNWLDETEKAIVTAVVFVATFLIALMIGRLLKRRAGVQLGLFFRLFCLALAFYVAMWVYGMSIDIRNHVGAALALLSTAILVALINRYVWDLYFEKKRGTTIPHFPRQLVALLIFLVVLLVVLWYGYHAGRWLTGLLAGSGIAAIILGLAGQNLLGGIIAGMSLQINRPYKVGDWLQVGDRYAEVMEINWRSTRLRTNDTIYLDIPNNEIVKQTIVNLHYPTEVHAMRIRIGLEYHVPPNLAKDVLIRAASKANGVLSHPPVRVFLVDFADFAIIYEIKFYMGNHARINEINDAIRTNIWYELKRERLTVPFPTRTLHLQRRTTRPQDEGYQEAREILRGEPIFECLSDTQIDNLVRHARLDHFGRGERVIEEGADGDSMFILLRGTASVAVSKNGATIQVAMLGAGDCFGEMSLLTGEKRSATVRADADCYVMEIGKPVMADVIREAPGCLEQLSDLLAKRKLENEGIFKEAAPKELTETRQREYRANFMRRLRTFFEL